MSALRRIYAIAINTVREAIRNKLLYTLLVFAVALIAMSVLASLLSYVERERIVQNLGLASIRLFGAGIAVFVGVGLIHGEVERRTIFTILSKPISRGEFLVGKYLGLVLTAWLMVVIMGAAFGGVSLMVDAPLDAAHAVALLLVAMELSLLLAVATLFSSFTTPMLSSLFSIGIYMIGHTTRNLVQIAERSETSGLDGFAHALYRVIPDLEMFNVSLQAVHGLPIAAHEIWLPVLYAAGYATALLTLATFIFGRRDFR